MYVYSCAPLFVTTLLPLLFLLVPVYSVLDWGKVDFGDFFNESGGLSKRATEVGWRQRSEENTT